MMQASNTKDRLDAMVTAEGLRACHLHGFGLHSISISAAEKKSRLGFFPSLWKRAQGRERTCLESPSLLWGRACFGRGL